MANDEHENRFRFARTPKALRFCERIAEALVRMCNKDQDESVRLINLFWKQRADIEADPFLYEEPAYYYAMVIAHHPDIGDNRPQWYKDRELWPPPKEWLDMG